MARMKKVEFDYYGYFRASGRSACEAANCLYETLAHYNPEILRDRAAAIHRIENEADAAKHEMTRHLTREFITPLEREDIISLAQEMDNVVDAADEVLQRAYMFNIKTLRPEIVTFAELIVKCCSALCATLDELSGFKKANSEINKHIVEVNTLESAGDALHNENIRRLFTEETDVRELVVWNIMFECLENCLDACEHAADVVETVIMKNA